MSLVSTRIENYTYDKEGWEIYTTDNCLVRRTKDSLEDVPLPEGVEFGTVWPGTLIAKSNGEYNEEWCDSFFDALNIFEEQLVEQYNMIQACKKQLGLEYSEYLNLRKKEMKNAINDLEETKRKLDWEVNILINEVKKKANVVLKGVDDLFPEDYRLKYVDEDLCNEV